MRRRMMIGDSAYKAELITDGLQFWFDGKNNLKGGGFSQSATTWYPYMKNSAIPDSYCLTKSGYGSWNSNGGFVASSDYNGTSSNGLFTNRQYSPFYYLPNVTDFTFVICLGNLSGWKEINTDIVSGTYSAGSGSHRWTLQLGAEGNYRFGLYGDSGWRNYYAKINTPTNTDIKTIIYVRKDSNISVYINSSLDNIISATNSYLGKQEYVCFSLISYAPGNVSITAPYYSCQMYNRALSEYEVVIAHNFIKNRYEL